MALRETLEVENSSSNVDFVTVDLIEDVMSMFFMETYSIYLLSASSRTATPIPRTGEGTGLNEVVKQLDGLCHKDSATTPG